MQIFVKKFFILFSVLVYLTSIFLFLNYQNSISEEKVRKRIKARTEDLTFISTLTYFRQSLENHSAGSTRIILNDFFRTHSDLNPIKAIVLSEKKGSPILSFAVVPGNETSYSSISSDLKLNDLSKNFVINNLLFIPIPFAEGKYVLVGVLRVDYLIDKVPGVVGVFQNLSGEIDVDTSFWKTIYDFLLKIILSTLLYIITLFLIFELLKRTSNSIETEKNRRYLALLANAKEIKYDVLKSFDITSKFFSFVKNAGVSKEVKEVEGWLSYAESYHIYAHQLMSDLDKLDSNTEVKIKESSLHNICKKISKELEVMSCGKTKLNLHLQHTGTVCFDSIRIERVLRNLVQNAHHYSKDSLSIREVWIETSQNRNGSINVTVGNTNSHILFENIKTIFDKGYATGKTNYGLYICKKIIRAHKSELVVRSDKKSTEFSFKLEGSK